jgi:RNA polymerase sigma factor (sigma-70 family)
MKNNSRHHDTALEQYMQDLGACAPMDAASEMRLALRMRRIRDRLGHLIDGLPEPHRGTILDGARPVPHLAFAKLDAIVRRLSREAERHPASGLEVPARRARALLGVLDAERSTFITKNLRLVFHFARRLSGLEAPLADLIQAGNLGLLEAVDRFDPRRGVRFSSYAGIWITRVILREAPGLTQAVRIPDYHMRLRSRMASSRSILVDRFGRQPTVPEMAAEAHMAESKIEDILQSEVTMIDLDAPRNSSGTMSLADTLAADEATAPHNATILKELLDQLEVMLASLEPRLRMVVRLRYGFEGERPHTLQEVGALLHLSRERVRQLEVKATTRLRERLLRRPGATGAAWPMSA